MSALEPGRLAAAGRTGLIAYFAGNPVAANLLMLLLFVGGVIAALQIPLQRYPDLQTRTISVSVASPGSSPSEVEADVNRRVEEAVVGLSGVARVVATASEGLGRIDIELATFANENTVLGDVQSAVDGIENFPPPNAEQPEVAVVRFPQEVITLAVSSALVDENGLRLAAEELRHEILQLPAVSHVRFGGTRDREITIELNEEQLRRYDLTISRIADAVRLDSLNLTSGELSTESGGVVLHTMAKRSHGEEFSDIPLITRLDGTIVTLGDVAEVRDGFVDEEVISEFDGKPAVLVLVFATEGQSVAAIADAVKALVADFELPQGVALTVWNDRSEFISNMLSAVMRNAVIGAILVLLCLVLVFDLGIAVWIALGIPFSFIGSLLLFGAADLTLNVATLFGFFLLIGIVVDDAVVVGESIGAARERGLEPLAAAISGARAVVGPVIIGACTTVVAFLPFLFVDVGYYQLVRVIPYVVVLVLAVSLIEAFLILPSHLSHRNRWSRPPLSDVQRWARGRIDDLRDRVVAPAVGWAIRRLGLTLAAAAAVVAGALLLLSTGIVPIVMFADVRGGHVHADLRLPVGAPFEVTQEVAERYARAGRAIDERLGAAAVDGMSVMVGNFGPTSPSTVLEGLPNSSHLASVTLHLNERSERLAASEEVARTWRQLVGDVAELESVVFATTNLRLPSAIAYAIVHEDTAVLEEAVAEFRAAAPTVPGLYGMTDSMVPGKRHLQLSLTELGKAAGLTPAAVGGQLRANLNGLEVQRIQRGHEEIKVMVRYPEERRRGLGELVSERIHRPGGGEIPLSAVAEITERREHATLSRIDGRPVARVNLYVVEAAITPIQARRYVESNVLTGLRERYPGIEIDPDGFARNERDLLNTMALLVPISLIAMYGLIAGFLRSYWKPLVAVMGIPVSFAGGVLGHWMLGWEFTVMSLFGTIAVAGVIVNDALVLLDRYNAMRREESAMPAIAVVSAATRHRFRAVLLTSVTTILGLSPMLYERSDEWIIFVPLIVSLLGGLVFSGVFTLFILPTLVMIVDGRRE